MLAWVLYPNFILIFKRAKTDVLKLICRLCVYETGHGGLVTQDSVM